jgi:hypothetical protein
MFNEAGPDFQALKDLPGLLLVDDADKVGLVGKLLKMIDTGIMDGLREEEVSAEMMKLAQKGLEEALQRISKQFGDSTGGYAPGGGSMGGADTGGDFAAATKMDLFKEAVCCMAGMECWTGAFAATQGRAALAAELAMLEAGLPELQAHFEELNLVNVQKAAAQLAADFADLKTLTRQLTNRVKDAVVELATYKR